MEGFCLKQHRFKTVTFGEIMAQMHLHYTFFFVRAWKMWHFLAVFICRPSISGSLPSDTWVWRIHPSVCSFTLSVIFFCLCVHQSIIQFAFVHIQFPTLSSICFLKKNHEENIWFTFAYFLSVFSITGVSFLRHGYGDGVVYCTFSGNNTVYSLPLTVLIILPSGEVDGYP